MGDVTWMGELPGSCDESRSTLVTPKKTQERPDVLILSRRRRGPVVPPVPDLSDVCGDSGPGGVYREPVQCKVGLRSAQPTVLLRPSEG